MANRYLNVCFSALLMVVGCSQLIGISDYEIDPSLDGDAGDPSGGEAGSSAGAGGKGGTPSGGGAPMGRAGEPSAGQGGEDNTPQAGQPGQAGGGGEGGEGGAAPVTIDCDSADCCDEAGGVVVETELVKNGNFEKGRSEWSSGYGVNDFAVIVQADDDSIIPYSGEWYAWLGGVEDDTCYLDSPSFIIPAGTQWITASGYRLFAFDSAAGTGDVVGVGLYEAGTANLIEAFGYWDNAEYDSDDFEEFSASVPALDYAEGEYQLSVLAETDLVFDDPPEDPEAQKASNFFFDDLSLKAAVCVAP